MKLLLCLLASAPFREKHKNLQKQYTNHPNYNDQKNKREFKNQKWQKISEDQKLSLAAWFPAAEHIPLQLNSIVSTFQQAY